MIKLLLILTLNTSALFASSFQDEATKVSDALKKNLMGNLQKKIQSDGVEAAVEFCHFNVKKLGAEIGEEFKGKYEYGRTSHKIRNAENEPQEWMKSYIASFQKKRNGEEGTAPLIHLGADGKKVYLEPLWVNSMCLNCHGTHLSPKIQTKITEFYPKDKATGFQVGDFRGFIWVKER